LPYLHEKRIYLNRIKNRIEYYYTSIESNVEDQEVYNKKLEEIYQPSNSPQVGSGMQMKKMTTLMSL